MGDKSTKEVNERSPVYTRLREKREGGGTKFTLDQNEST